MQSIPPFIGIDPVKGEEVTTLSIEEKEKILQRNSWFIGPIREVDWMYYNHLFFDGEFVEISAGYHATNEYTYGPPSWISTLWYVVWEETWRYEVVEDGVELYDDLDGEEHCIGKIELIFTEDAPLRANIPALGEAPAAQDLYMYEDKGE